MLCSSAENRRVCASCVMSMISSECTCTAFFSAELPGFSPALPIVLQPVKECVCIFFGQLFVGAFRCFQRHLDLFCPLLRVHFDVMKEALIHQSPELKQCLEPWDLLQYHQQSRNPDWSAGDQVLYRVCLYRL